MSPAAVSAYTLIVGGGGGGAGAMVEVVAAGSVVGTLGAAASTATVGGGVGAELVDGSLQPTATSPTAANRARRRCVEAGRRRGLRSGTDRPSCPSRRPQTGQ